MVVRTWRKCARALRTGPSGNWRARRASRRPACSGSGGPSACSAGAPRRSRSPPTRCSSTRSATSSASTSAFRRTRRSSAWTRNPRSRPWNAPRRCCRCCAGHASGAVFDYERHGTTDLFAALDIATGKVITKLSARHTAIDFRNFLDEIDLRGRTRPGSPRHLRQPLHPQGTRRAEMAAGPPPLRPALHAHLLIVDQPGRAVVRRDPAPLPGPRRVLLPRRPHHRAPGMDQDLERLRQAFKWTKTPDQIIDAICRYCDESHDQLTSRVAPPARVPRFPSVPQDPSPSSLEPTLHSCQTLHSSRTLLPSLNRFILSGSYVKSADCPQDRDVARISRRGLNSWERTNCKGSRMDCSRATAAPTSPRTLQTQCWPRCGVRHCGCGGEANGRHTHIRTSRRQYPEFHRQERQSA